MSTITEVEATPQAIDDLVGRLFTEGVGAFHIGTVYLGLKHGLFAALVADGPLTAAELAGRAGLDGWYVREWLQAETTAGLVLADDDDLSRARFTAAPGVREALVDETGPAYLGGLPVAVTAGFSAMPQLLAAFRTGAGVPYASYGVEAVEAQAALNRPAFVNQLVAEWIPQIPDVAAQLGDRDRTVRVADVGCGLGWAAIELAKAYPHLQVDGYDSDEESIARARRNAADAGVSDRVTFDVVDASSGYGQGRYDLITFFECVHDMAHPVTAIAQAKAALVRGRDRDRDGRAGGRATQCGRPCPDVLRDRERAVVPTAGPRRARLRSGRHDDVGQPVPRHRAGGWLVRRRDPADRPSVLEVLSTGRLSRRLLDSWATESAPFASICTGCNRCRSKERVQIHPWRS